MQRIDIDKIAEILEQKDFKELKTFVKEDALIEEFDFDDVAYNIVQQIEAEEELMEYFKEVSKEKSSLRSLFKYCKKIKNARFFIDNKDEYELENSFIYELEKMFDDREKEAFEKRANERLEKDNKHFILGVVFVFVITILVNYIWLKPYISAYLIGDFKIVDAQVTGQNRFMNFNNMIVASLDYKFVVDSVEYKGSETKTFLNFLGWGVPEVKNTIKIYYDKNSPEKSNIILNSWIFIGLVFIWDFLVISGLPKSYKSYKKYKKLNSKEKNVDK